MLAKAAALAAPAAAALALAALPLRAQEAPPPAAAPPAGAAPAAASTPRFPACPPRAPRVRVVLDDPEPTLLGGADIDELHARTRQPRTTHTHHLALTTSRVDWRSEITAHYARAPGPGPVCAVAGAVTVHLVHAEHVIRLAREIPEGGCLWNEVLAHERRHVAVNRRTVRAALGRVRAAAEAWAAQAETRAPEVEPAVTALQEGLRRAIEPALAAMRAERERGHRAIDTREEYRRLARVCPGDQAVLRTMLGEH